MKAILISGTPGTGKKTLAGNLSKKIKYEILNIKNIIKKSKIKYSKKKSTYIINEKKFIKLLIKEIKKNQNLIIPSHLSHLIPKKHSKICFILRCPPKILEKRLNKRRYNKEKIRENIEVEVLGTCLAEALSKGHKIHEIDTSKKTKKQTLNQALKALKTGKNQYGKTNWSKEFLEYLK